MKQFILSTWSFVALLSCTSTSFAAKNCKCLYGQSCWPSNEAFTNLTSQLSQPLLHPAPIGQACYSADAPSGNCTDVQAHRSDGMWRSGQAGALQIANYEAYIFKKNNTISACYLNTTLGFPCEQGSIPPVGVDARTPEDVQAAVRFAKTHNLKVVVKNTGHDYLGRSTGRNGFLIWTHWMKDTKFNESFVVEGSPAGGTTYQAITLSAGVQWGEAYAFAAQNNRFLVGGISDGFSVGAAGGWIMGAGHSAFAPRHGLGVDNVLQFDVVLANGTRVTANSHQHPDLFWALRGGGGGTFGIVTSATYQTHPVFPLTMGLLVTAFPTNTTEAAMSVITEFVRLHPTLSDQGWGGYSWMAKEFFIAQWLAPNVSQADTEATLAPFVDLVKTATGNATGVQFMTTPFESFEQWRTNPATGTSGAPQAPPAIGVIVELASRLLPRQLALDDPAKAARVILQVNTTVGFNSVAGGAVSRVDPDSMALIPSWRNAVAHAWIGANWNDGDSVQTINSVIEDLKQKTRVLDQLTTDSGSYLNEGSRHEDNFKKTFFGSHYDRLERIKRSYDPTSLFLVTSGVGSEEWDSELVCHK